MTPDEAVFADRSERGKLRVTGPKRAWFLDQILTQSFEDMKPGDARDAALLTVHGRMTAYLEALTAEDSILCHYESELTGILPDALSRYLLATDAAVDDVTDDFGLVLVVGNEWRALAEKAAPGAPLQETSGLGTSSGYIWIDRAGVDDLVAALAAEGVRAAPEDELEALRIANGVARWGREMDSKTFPQEAGVDERAVQFEKGCYLGQEAMAKIHFRGKVNRRLARVHGEDRLQVGAEVVLDGKKIGAITSSSNGAGLAIVRHDVPAGASVKVGAVDATLVG